MRWGSKNIGFTNYATYGVMRHTQKYMQLTYPEWANSTDAS